MQKLIFGFIVAFCLHIGSATSADMVYQFKNPSFNGQGYSAHVLSLEQLQFNRQKDIDDEIQAELDRIERELENSVLNKFIRNLESRIYATLSKQLVDNIFADCGGETGVECTNTGTAEIEDATITWSRDEVTGAITLIIDSADGYTEIVIPSLGELAF